MAGGDRECIGNAKTLKSWKLLSFPNLPEVLAQSLGHEMLARCQVPSILTLLNPPLTSNLSNPNLGDLGRKVW